MPKQYLLSIAVAVGLSISSQSFAQQSPVKIEANQLTDNIYMITGKGGNIGLLTGQEGSFLIDDQFAPLTEQIIEVVQVSRW